MKKPNEIKEIVDVEEFLKIGDDSTRMALLFIILREKKVSVDYLRKTLGIRGNTIYYHLNKLEKTGIVSMRTEPVEGTNLSRKIFQLNPLFWNKKNDPEWRSLVEKNFKVAFLIEMHMAVASLMEAIRTFREIPEEVFKKYYLENNPKCEVLFLKKKDFLQLQSIINEFLHETLKIDEQKMLDKSEGYVYSIFAYPPLKTTKQV